MKNMKCIIGATILAPICIVLIFALGVGFSIALDWISVNLPVLFWVFATVFILFFIVCLWIPIKT